MAEQRSGGGRKRSILARFFFLVCIMILGPILLTLLVFYRTIPDRMEEQAQGNADFYMGQVATGRDDTPEGLMEAALAVTPERIMDAARSVSLDTVYFLTGKEAANS